MTTLHSVQKLTQEVRSRRDVAQAQIDRFIKDVQNSPHIAMRSSNWAFSAAAMLSVYGFFLSMLEQHMDELMSDPSLLPDLYGGQRDALLHALVHSQQTDTPSGRLFERAEQSAYASLIKLLGEFVGAEYKEAVRRTSVGESSDNGIDLQS